jgi:dihydrofolate reductase
MRPLRYSINVTLDGCCDHTAATPSQEMHQHAAGLIASADALILGRVTYEMMESAFREPSPELPDWMVPFARTMDAAKKYVVSSTLGQVDWNAELLGGDLREAVLALKEQPGGGLYVGGVALPAALAGWGLIDEYVLVVHPLVAGRGPRLLDGVQLDLELVDQLDLPDGVVARTYRPRAG